MTPDHATPPELDAVPSGPVVTPSPAGEMSLNRMSVRPFAGPPEVPGHRGYRANFGPEGRYSGAVDPEEAPERGGAPPRAGNSGRPPPSPGTPFYDAIMASRARVHRRRFIALAATGGVVAAGAATLAVAEATGGSGQPTSNIGRAHV